MQKFLVDILFILGGEKRDILANDYGVPMTKQFESEVEEMCNVSEGVFERGIERGIEQGELKLS